MDSQTRTCLDLKNALIRFDESGEEVNYDLVQQIDTCKVIASANISKLQKDRDMLEIQFNEIKNKVDSMLVTPDSRITWGDKKAVLKSDISAIDQKVRKFTDLNNRIGFFLRSNSPEQSSQEVMVTTSQGMDKQETGEQFTMGGKKRGRPRRK